MSVKKITLIEFFLWLVILALFVAFLSPFVYGFKIKHDYSEIIQGLSKSLHVKINIVKYEQGFFSSTLDLVIDFPRLDGRILVKEKIIHGPIYIGLLKQKKSPFINAVVHGELSTSLKQQPLLKELFSNNSAPAYQTIIHYSGDVDTQLYVPSIHTQLLKDTTSLQIDSTAILINRYYSPLNSDVSSDIDVPLFKFKSKEITINIDSLYMSFIGTDEGLKDILIGDAIIAIGSFDMDSGVDQLTLRGVVLHLLSSEKNNLFDIESQLNIQKIFSSNHKFGPLVFGLNLGGINYNKLNEVKNAYDGKQKRVAKKGSVNVFAGNSMQLVKQASQVIKHIEIKEFKIASELGGLNAKFNFKLGSSQQSKLKDETKLSVLNLDLDAKADSMLLKQIISWELENEFKSIFKFYTPVIKKEETKQLHDKKVLKKLRQLMDESWLAYSDHQYHSKITLYKGKLLVNNQIERSIEQVIESINFVADIQ